MNPSYYHLLSISRTATAAEIRQAYVKVVKHIHPDLAGPAPRPAARLEDLQRAYRCLLDPEARRIYDAQLDESELAHAERLRRVEQRLSRRSGRRRGVRAIDRSGRPRPSLLRPTWRLILLIAGGALVITKMQSVYGIF